MTGRTRAPEPAAGVPPPPRLVPAGAWFDVTLLLLLVGLTVALAAQTPLITLDIAVRNLSDNYRPPEMTLVARALNYLGQGLPLAGICLVLAFVHCRRRNNYEPLLPVVTALAATYASLGVVKLFTDRGSPHYGAVLLFGESTGISYPSGHAANVVVWYGVLTMLLAPFVAPWVRKLLRYGPAVAVCFATTYLGYHWVTDTVAGLLMGLVIDRAIRRNPWRQWPWLMDQVTRPRLLRKEPRRSGNPEPPPTGLARRLGLTDAVVIGLGSMLGAGVFVAFAPAAGLAGGPGMLLALGVAGVVAYCNATSSARLAARYPESGGTYVYGRERLGEFPGFLAGWCFVVGKTASCAAMALTVGHYLWPAYPQAVAVATVALVTLLNLRGVERTARATKVFAGLTLAVLAVVVVTGLVGGDPSLDRLGPPSAASWSGVLGAAGLLFFAFAGYARVATLGEEVRDPERTIPRAVPIALGVVFVVYAVVGSTALLVVGPGRLASSVAPLADVTDAAGAPVLNGVVRAGAALAVLGVLVSLLAGVGRTTFAMARRSDLPVALATVHPRFRVPHRAELAVTVAVALLAVTGDLRGAIGFSSFTVLTYYGLTNLSALTLGRADGRWRQGIAVAGLAGCVTLAFALPYRSVLAGLGVLAAGALWYLVRRHMVHRTAPETRQGGDATLGAAGGHTVRGG